VTTTPDRPTRVIRPAHGIITAPALIPHPRSRSRSRLIDAVVFIAACPACGQDAKWYEERVDTAVHTEVGCPCP
jgi:hypothetical protein